MKPLCNMGINCTSVPSFVLTFLPKLTFDPRPLPTKIATKPSLETCLTVIIFSKDL